MGGISRLRFEHLIQPRILIEFAHENLFDQLPQALLAAGVVIVGLFVIVLIRKLLSLCCLPKRYHEEWVLFEEIDNNNGERKRVFRKTRQKRWTSRAHLFLETFFFIGSVLVMWIGAHVAGFQFWTSSLVGVGLGAGITYIFGTPLQLIGSAYAIYASGVIREGQYLYINGVSGRITEIHPMGVELEGVDPKHGSAVKHNIPTTHILMQMWTRKYYEEFTEPSTTRDPNKIPKEKRLKTIPDDVRLHMPQHKSQREREYFVGQKVGDKKLE